MLKVAITGSKGFVGSALKKQLKDVEIIEIDFEFGYDLTDWDSLSNIGHFDVLIHLAAKSFVPDSFENPASFYKTNVIGTLNALELCRKYNARIIYTSSYVYGAPDYLPIDELHPLKAFNPYAQSKLMGEDLCQAYYRDFNVHAIIFRPFNIYGKGQGAHFLIQAILNQANSGHIKLKDSRPKRDFIYIDDIVEAYVKGVYTDFDGVEIFNLGSGVSTSIKELTQIISKHFDNQFSVSFTEEQRKNEVLETRCNISKAMKLLNWKPKVSIEDGVSLILHK